MDCSIVHTVLVMDTQPYTYVRTYFTCGKRLGYVLNNQTNTYLCNFFRAVHTSGKTLSLADSIIPAGRHSGGNTVVMARIIFNCHLLTYVCMCIYLVRTSS